MHQLHINTEHHLTSYTYVYSHMHAQIYKTCTQPFGGSRATKAGSNGVAMSVITVAQRSPLAHLRYIRIHPALLIPHVTNTQHYLHPTLWYETAGPSATNTNTLQCGQLFEQTVRHSSTTDITTVKHNRHYDNHCTNITAHQHCITFTINNMD